MDNKKAVSWGLEKLGKWIVAGAVLVIVLLIIINIWNGGSILDYIKDIMLGK